MKVAGIGAANGVGDDHTLGCYSSLSFTKTSCSVQCPPPESRAMAYIAVVAHHCGTSPQNLTSGSTAPFDSGLCGSANLRIHRKCEERPT